VWDFSWRFEKRVSFAMSGLSGADGNSGSFFTAMFPSPDEIEFQAFDIRLLKNSVQRANLRLNRGLAEER